MAALAGYKIAKASEEDAPSIATCWFDAFLNTTHPQKAFYEHMLPNTPNVHRFFSDSIAEQMRREHSSVFLKALGPDGQLVGFAIWTAPGVGELYWADYAEESDAMLCDALFGAMAQHRGKLMGKRRHWCKSLLLTRVVVLSDETLDAALMGVGAEHARKGVGAMLLDYGCKLADRDGIEAYVNASPAARLLYQRFGFSTRASMTMLEPSGSYREYFMVRSVKSTP